MLYTKNLRNIGKIPFISRIPSHRIEPAMPALPAPEPPLPALPAPVPLPALPAPVPKPPSVQAPDKSCIGERQYALTKEELETLGKW